MAEYCKCGSLMINNVCTNQKCKLSQGKKPVKKSAAAAKVYKKRASRVKTYKLEDSNKHI
ncbi:MAG: hypothetical protein PHV32_05730 [Eubacteriales bacterium]|nr:hypothetical protein [Eubacteriales bacterium]